MVLSLLWLSSYIVLRALHIYLGTPFNELALWGNATVQLSLTLLWVSLAFMTMSLASRKQLRSVWILGGSILVIVTLKLVLFDLSHIGTLTRVISFLGAGFVMLLIAYIAPIPEGSLVKILPKFLLGKGIFFKSNSSYIPRFFASYECLKYILFIVRSFHCHNFSIKSKCICVRPSLTFERPK